MACVGLRAASLGARAARCHPPSLVIGAGACGALAPDLSVGDLIVPEAVVTTYGDRWPTAPLPAVRRAGVLLTVAETISTAEEKAKLWITTGALAVDMESASILAWARARGVAAAVVRAVSDHARAGVPPDLTALVESDGRVRTGAALRAMLARPSALADAITLGRGTSAALKAVAAALGRVARSV